MLACAFTIPDGVIEMLSKKLAVLTGALLVLAPGAAPLSHAQSAGWCSSVHIVFFPGGPAGGVFANNVYNGAKQAQADLGPRVDYIFSNWDPQTMIQQFNEAAATKPDGIAIMGHPGDEAFDALIDNAEAQGIIVTSQNTQLPNAESKYATQGFGYVGQDLYGSGMKLGVEAVSRFGLKQGDRAMVWGLLSQPTAVCVPRAPSTRSSKRAYRSTTWRSTPRQTPTPRRARRPSPAMSRHTRM
jgi:simple sugar transport system substrate-binding protein